MSTGLATCREAAPADFATVRALCWAYRDLLLERTAGITDIVHHYYAEASYAALLAKLEEVHAPPKGAIYVAEHEGKIIGCGMTHEVAPGRTEIKRVYVVPEARGCGAAIAIFQRAIEDARSAGADQLVLDTMTFLPEAVSLYKKLGLGPVEPFYTPEPRYAHYVRFFGCDL